MKRKLFAILAVFAVALTIPVQAPAEMTEVERSGMPAAVTPDRGNRLPAFTKAVGAVGTPGPEPRPSGQPTAVSGVFESIPGARLVSIALVPSLPRVSIQVQDGKTGAVHAWDRLGNPVPPMCVPDRARLLSGPSDTWGPRFVQGEWFYLPSDSLTVQLPDRCNWLVQPAASGAVKAVAASGAHLISVEAEGQELRAYDLDEWMDSVVPRPRPAGRRIVPRPRMPLGHILPGALGPVECITEGPLSAAVLVVANTGGHRALYVVRAPGRGRPLDWQAELISVEPGALGGEVLACAAARDALYVSVKGRGVERLAFQQAAPPRAGWAVRRTGTVTLNRGEGPIDFVVLAADDSDPATAAVYAVAGDEHVYRFSRDLVPEQRQGPRPSGIPTATCQWKGGALGLGKGPWRGQILDAATKAPLGGVAVVAHWSLREASVGGWAGGGYHDSAEVITGPDGCFQIPRRPLDRPRLFTTIKGPEWTFFKSGYGRWRLAGRDTWFDDVDDKVTEAWSRVYTTGVVLELDPLGRRPELEKFLFLHSPGEVPRERIPRFMEMLNAERVRRGLSPLGPLPRDAR